MSTEGSTTGLARLQTELQRSIVAGDESFTGAAGDSRVDTATRLRIYSVAYRVRLIEALAANFPFLKRFLGDEEFARIARNYLAAFPSDNVSVRWFGHRLAGFLRDSMPADTPECAAELAQLEWAIAGAFDAEDAEPADQQAMAIAPEDWPQLRFKLHPSVRLLEVRTNAVAIFTALTADGHPPAPEFLDGEQAYVIWRAGLDVRFREQSKDEAHALATLSANGTFATACEALCAWQDESEVPVRAASLLKTWLMEGMIAGVITAAAP